MLRFLVLLLFLLNCRNIAASLALSPEMQKLSDDYWEWKMSDMPQFATFVGIHKYDAFVDDMSEEAYLARYTKCQEFLQQVNQLESSLINETDKVNLKVLKYELETYISGNDFKGFYLPMNYMEGPQVDMERIFGWMLRDTAEDYDVMLRRMENLPAQIDQIINLMKAGVENNITYHEISMKDLDASIGKFVVVDPKESPFYSFFNESFPDTMDEDLISHLKVKAQTVIKEKVSPAYKKLLEYVLNEYETRKDIAANTVKNGHEFYNQLIRFHTSTNDSAEDIHTIGLKEVDRIEKEMEKIIAEMGYTGMRQQEFSNNIRNDPNNTYTTSDEVMKAFEQIVYDIVPPKLPQIFKNIPKAKLKVTEAPDPNSPFAYYLGGSYDGSRPGAFYVNNYNPAGQTKYTMISLSLHEGNPGHHLQGSHSIESPTFPFFRRVLEDRNYGISPSRFPLYTYFAEGWALYSEGLGFDMSLYDNPLDRYGHYSEEIFRACRLVVDTGIHAMGWTKQEAVDYMLNHTASSKPLIENEVDRYITWPGQALAYKIGQLKIAELRSDAEAKLGNLFNIKDFHDIILNSFGPIDMATDEIKLWIDDVLKNGNKSM